MVELIVSGPGDVLVSTGGGLLVGVLSDSGGGRDSVELLSGGRLLSLVMIVLQLSSGSVELEIGGSLEVMVEHGSDEGGGVDDGMGDD